MNIKSFLEETVFNLPQELFDSLKKALIVDSLPFQFVDFQFLSPDMITKEILGEKLYSYFTMVGFKNGMTFEKLLEKYTSDIDEIVSSKLVRETKSNEDGKEVIIPTRVKKYYDRAITLKNVKTFEMREMVDYSRIMFCLYVEIINNHYKPISNFNLSLDVINHGPIISSMKTVPGYSFAFFSKKYRFDIDDPCGLDRCTFIIAIIICHFLKKNAVAEEN